MKMRRHLLGGLAIGACLFAATPAVSTGVAGAAAPVVAPVGVTPTTEPDVELGVPTSVVREPTSPVEVRGARAENSSDSGFDWQWLLLLALIPIGVMVAIRWSMTRRASAPV